ncbi:MAG: hypothetical protein KatS3mg083_317 [Candidatus Dojkabacteria bacterium]|nr:MAG: hypothetical protein KatS3mg083_317 [Candidatus Dojkabacteria bacterium]
MSQEQQVPHIHIYQSTRIQVLEQCKKAQNPNDKLRYVNPALEYLALYGIRQEQIPSNVLFVNSTHARLPGLGGQTHAVFLQYANGRTSEQAILIHENTKTNLPDPFLTRLVIHELVHAALLALHGRTKTEIFPPIFAEGMAEYIAVMYTVPDIIIGIIFDEMRASLLNYKTQIHQGITDSAWKNALVKLQQLTAETLRVSRDKGYLYPEGIAMYLHTNLRQLISDNKQFPIPQLQKYLLEILASVHGRLFRDNIPDPRDPTRIVPPPIYWTFKKTIDWTFQDHTFRHNLLHLTVSAYAAYAVRVLEAKFPGVLTDLLEGLNESNKKDVLKRLKNRIGYTLYDDLAKLGYSEQDFRIALSMIREH